jgi:hypothetical protein
MNRRVVVGNLPSSASEHQLRRLYATHGEAVSVSTMEAESPDRFRGLGGSNPTALVELEPVVALPRPALMQTPAARPVWVNGTLSGLMAGKRPASKSTGFAWGV